MSAQMNYSFSTPIGQPGGIYDLAPYAVEAFIVESNDGVMKSGMGVVSGTKPGSNIVVPDSNATVAAFEGIATNRRTNENTRFGGVEINKGIALGVMRWGRIYAQLATNVDPAYGDKAYLVIDGDDAGCFTNAADNGETGDNKVEYLDVHANFRGTASNGICLVELFNDARA